MVAQSAALLGWSLLVAGTFVTLREVFRPRMPHYQIQIQGLAWHRAIEHASWQLDLILQQNQQNQQKQQQQQEQPRPLQPQSKRQRRQRRRKQQQRRRRSPQQESASSVPSVISSTHGNYTDSDNDDDNNNNSRSIRKGHDLMHDSATVAVRQSSNESRQSSNESLQSSNESSSLRMPSSSSSSSSSFSSSYLLDWRNCLWHWLIGSMIQLHQTVRVWCMAAFSLSRTVPLHMHIQVHNDNIVPMHVYALSFDFFAAVVPTSLKTTTTKTISPQQQQQKQKQANPTSASWWRALGRRIRRPFVRNIDRVPHLAYMGNFKNAQHYQHDEMEQFHQQHQQQQHNPRKQRPTEGGSLSAAPPTMLFPMPSQSMTDTDQIMYLSIDPWQALISMPQLGRQLWDGSGSMVVPSTGVAWIRVGPPPSKLAMMGQQKQSPRGHENEPQQQQQESRRSKKNGTSNRPQSPQQQQPSQQLAGQSTARAALPSPPISWWWSQWRWRNNKNNNHEHQLISRPHHHDLTVLEEAAATTTALNNPTIITTQATGAATNPQTSATAMSLNNKRDASSSTKVRNGESSPSPLDATPDDYMISKTISFDENSFSNESDDGMMERRGNNKDPEPSLLNTVEDSQIMIASDISRPHPQQQGSDRIPSRKNKGTNRSHVIQIDKNDEKHGMMARLPLTESIHALDLVDSIDKFEEANTLDSDPKEIFELSNDLNYSHQDDHKTSVYDDDDDNHNATITISSSTTNSNDQGSNGECIDPPTKPVSQKSSSGIFAAAASNDVHHSVALVQSSNGNQDDPSLETGSSTQQEQVVADEKEGLLWIPMTVSVICDNVVTPLRMEIQGVTCELYRMEPGWMDIRQTMATVSQYATTQLGKPRHAVSSTVVPSPIRYHHDRTTIKSITTTTSEDDDDEMKIVDQQSSPTTRILLTGGLLDTYLDPPQLGSPELIDKTYLGGWSMSKILHQVGLKEFLQWF